MRSLQAVLCLTACAALLPAQPRAARPEAYADLLRRLDAMTSLPLTQWRTHADMPHGEDPSLDDSNWTALTLTDGRGGRGGASDVAWYRTTFIVPATAGGHDLRGARLRLQLRLSNDGRVFLNGGLVAQGEGRTLDPIVVAAQAMPGQKLQIAIKTPFHAESGRMQSAQLLVDYPGQPDPGVLRNEIVAAENVLSGFPSGQAEHRQQLDAAVKAIDLTALDRGDMMAFTVSLKLAHQNLQPVNDWMKQFTVRVVGNAHIDMAWLWPWTETVEVVRDTFTTALQLMKEYPDFTYTQSSVQDFEWLQQKYPAMFREIQQRVKEGRWELVGGMWVEPDLNMPDGESMVRQLLVGKRWFRKYFDKDVTIGWNPDTFGYSWQLPQIYKKSGIDTFVTQKMAWNQNESSWRETFVFPYKLFWWQSPDGSKVLTYFPHGYGAGISPASLSQDVADYVPADGFPQIMHLYGVGDHGGGPTRQMIDEALRLKDSSTVFPKLQFSTARSFFDDAEKAIDAGTVKPPVWNNELYLAYHRGCYTTQAETKRLIRRNEELLQNAEKFASLSLLAANRPYSNGEFEEIWKRVLFDHFHDIMPGSGIQVNYDDAERNLTDASLRSQKILDGAFDSLNGLIDTRGEGTPVVVYNPLSWDRSGPVRIEANELLPGQHLEAREAGGQPLLSQIVATDPAAHKMTLEVMAKAVPAMGYQVIHLSAGRQSLKAYRAINPQRRRHYDRERISACDDRSHDGMHHQPGGQAGQSRVGRAGWMRQSVAGLQGRAAHAGRLGDPLRRGCVGFEAAEIRDRSAAWTRARGRAHRAHLPELDDSPGPHRLRRCAARRCEHPCGLARAAYPAQGRLSGKRAERQGDVRNSLRHYSAAHHAQYARGARHVRGARSALGRSLECSAGIQPAQ